MLLTKYYSTDKRKNEMGRVCSTYGRENRAAYRVLVARPEGKRQLERPRHTGSIILKMELQDVLWGGMD
jgi:hypothetical protein